RLASSSRAVPRSLPGSSSPHPALPHQGGGSHIFTLPPGGGRPGWGGMRDKTDLGMTLRLRGARYKRRSFAVIVSGSRGRSHAVASNQAGLGYRINFIL